MEVKIVFKLLYDRKRDGTLVEFRDKYNRLRAHIDRLQMAGTLPRGEVLWSVEHKRPEPQPPAVPARVVGFVPVHTVCGPVMIHRQGTRLDPERIAM